jgi:CheY-like chemotaxis protein
MRSKKPILLVEDDSVDIMTIKRALQDIHVTNHLDVSNNGEEALRHF